MSEPTKRFTNPGDLFHNPFSPGSYEWGMQEYVIDARLNAIILNTSVQLTSGMLIHRGTPRDAGENPKDVYERYLELKAAAEERELEEQRAKRRSEIIRDIAATEAKAEVTPPTPVSWDQLHGVNHE